MSSITKPTRPQQAYLEAPDAKPDRAKPKRRPPAPRVQISLTVAGDVLRQLDEMAAKYGQTRAGLIGIGIARVLRDGV
jgi:uncharacterized protein (DUF4415 family)